MVRISSGDRVVYATTATTKAQVVGHYTAAGPRLLIHLRDRPLTLQRFPKGVAAKGFMQKNASEYFPDFIERHVLERADGVTTHPVVMDVAGIEYLANQNTITFHVPTTTRTSPDRPDRMIIDLDPPEHAVGPARAAAWATKDLFDELRVPTVPMATGSKGFHIIAAIAGDAAVPEVDAFSQMAAALLAHRHPDLMTTHFRKAKRGGRVFCDWLRNRWGATSVAPWSLRPRPRPSVAVPIEWQMLDEITPDAFEIDDLPTADPLAGLLETPVGLSEPRAALSDLVAAAGVTVEPFDRFRS